MALPKLSLTHMKFAMVGAVNTAVDFGIYSGLVLTGLTPFVANLFSTSTGMCVSYFLNKHFTFKSSGQNNRRQFILFLTFTLSSLWVLQPVVIYLFKAFCEHALQLHNHTTEVFLAGKLLSIGVSLIWNYFWYSRHVFVENNAAD